MKPYAGNGRWLPKPYAGPILTRAPGILSISPNNGPQSGGVAITLTGYNFTGATSVTIGGVPCTGVVVVSDSYIIATTPATGMGALDVVVTTSTGSGTLAGGYTAGWTPATPSGLLLWLRADLGVTIGTGVSAWADQSGSGNNVSQATGSKQPTLNASDAAYNNQKTLTFASASTQVMQSAALAGGSLSTFTAMIVGNDDGTNAYYLSDIPGNTYVVYTQFGDYRAAGTVALDSGVAIATGPRVFIIVCNGASSSIFISANTAKASGNLGTTTFASVDLGYAGNYLNGKIAEVAIWNGVKTPTDINNALAYAGSRYGISIGP